MLSEFDYVFAENGLVAYKAGQLLAVQSLSKHLGEANLKEFINFCLKYLAGKAGACVRVGGGLQCGCWRHGRGLCDRCLTHSLSCT